jgi:hypothetical protein
MLSNLQGLYNTYQLAVDPNWDEVYAFYMKQSQDNGKTIKDYNMPGRDAILPCKTVVEELRSLPSRESAGTILRLNHLGDKVLNDLLFEDYLPNNVGTLGTSPGPQYATAAASVRKQLAVFDTGSVSRQIREFFDRKPQVITTRDIGILVLRILWSVSLSPGQYPPEGVIEAIEQTQKNALNCALVPRALPHGLQRLAASTYCNLEEVLAARSTARSALSSQCPAYTALHTAKLIDTLYFAGGLALPQLLTTGLVVLYAPESPLGANDRHLMKGSVRSFVYEVARIFPAVGCVPHHDLVSDRGILLNLRTALRDPAIWGERADTEFRVRPTCQYEPCIREVAWANAASGPGTQGRGCPATALSIAVLERFFEAIQQEQHLWELIPPVEPIRFGTRVTGMLGIRRKQV